MKKHLVALAALLAAVSTATAQTPASPDGDWRGSVSAGAVTLRMALHLGETSTFDSPDQGALGMSAHRTVDGRRVTVTIDKVGVFEGEVSEDGAQLRGALKQGPVSTPMVLERGLHAELRRPQTPVAPFPYKSLDVGYDNPKQPGVHLAGTLTVPEGKGPFPAVLLITGSGSQDRDETIVGHKPFLVLADHLTRRGVAVLRVDDRGVGGSTGGAGGTTADFATDVEAGVAWLKARTDIDPRRIGLIGHSEGGAIAPLVASRDPSIAFIVMWAGPGVPGADIIVEQVRAGALASGASAAAAEKSAQVQRAVMDAVLAAPDAEAVRAAVQKALADNGAPPTDEASLRALASPWYRQFIACDPAPALRAVRAPVLALLGGKDTQVTAAQNEPALKSALHDNPRAEVRTLPGLNHLFQTANTGAVSEYRVIEETISPAALKIIADWIDAVTAR